MSEVVLYDYWRSSAAYRVRIALNLKGIGYRREAIDLVEGKQRSADYRRLNPQGLVPALAIDGALLTQSMAIVEYLDERFPDPALLPTDLLERSRVRALALSVVADIHPLNNLRVLNWLRGELCQGEEAVMQWYHHWIAEGFAALEAEAPEAGLFGEDRPNLADLCLVPQMANARRFEVPLGAFPRLVRIDAALRALPAFAAAAPEAVKN
ncbi:MAG: maleylacetoacetate isomerase [Novosphingobium sp.]|uniref:maleylacetoacetate isomerase n=1 Tax=Novosphingobium sp. TaxID=1874826 RepID=UPI001D1BB89B|nr:maleylacetoacetate isomerase [Novosphingobium sp.]MCB2058572.1 maleylacetoacetate isomerase [Novosphingobium sp.]MCP5387647.1 maleylacetoacetate isomerase [Novosphingobium sp.]